MSKNTKIILAISAGVVVVCCGLALIAYFYFGRALGRSITMNPADKSRIGHEIADYTLPEGYEEMMAVNMLGLKMVVIGSSSSSSDQTVLMLMQMPTTGNMNQEEMQRQMRQAWEGQAGKQSQNYTVVGTRDVTVRGDTVTLTISESTAQGSEMVMRQEMAIFTGASEKMVMFMAMGEKDKFEEGIVDEFLGSIR